MTNKIGSRWDDYNAQLKFTINYKLKPHMIVHAIRRAVNISMSHPLEVHCRVMVSVVTRFSPFTIYSYGIAKQKISFEVCRCGSEYTESKLIRRERVLITEYMSPMDLMTSLPFQPTFHIWVLTRLLPPARHLNLDPTSYRSAYRTQTLCTINPTFRVERANHS